MNGDRSTVLDRIRRARTGRAADVDAGFAGMTAERNLAAPALPQIGDDLVAIFSGRARKLSSDVIGPVVKVDVGREVARYLQDHGLPNRAVCWPEIAAHDWVAAGITVEARAARDTDLVGITGAFCAIAETGTLMLLSGPATPATVSLLPETHIALLPVRRIVARMEDAWALVRREHAQLPRAVNFVSGPSRTADIEQTVTLGAHGPYRVLIILIRE